MKEQWKDIPGWEGLYKASNYGNIKSVDRKVNTNYVRGGKTIKSYNIYKGKLLRPRYQRQGYVLVALQNLKRNDLLVHRLIMLTFRGYSKLTVNHKNGIKDDNRLVNLEYMTQSENSKHAFDTGLNKPRKGKFNGMSRKVALIDDKGNTIKEFDCIKEASDKTNTSRVGIIEVCKGRNKTAGNKMWKYI